MDDTRPMRDPLESVIPVTVTHDASQEVLSALTMSATHWRIDPESSTPTTRPREFGLELPTSIPEGDGPRFRLRRMIGKGGCGEVFEAHQESLLRAVAVKRIRERPHADEQDRARLRAGFLNESLVTANLEHPNIVPVHDLGIDERGNPLLAMKLVRGKGWDRIVKEDFESGLSLDERLARQLPVLIAMAQAVSFAHSRGIVHRDLKPAQVVVGEFGEAVLMDWGLALFVGVPPSPSEGAEESFVTSQLTSLPTPKDAGGPAGTPALMAPEQTYRDAKLVGPWTDVFLLGATLYYLLTGHYPYSGTDYSEVMHKASSHLFEKPSTRAEGLPHDLEALCLRAMARNPEDRLPSARAFVEGLQDYLSGASRRRESERLTAEGAKALADAEGRYVSLAEALSLASRALSTWPQNLAAVALREKAAGAYAAAALDKGDLALAQLQSESLHHAASRAELLRSVEAARTVVAAKERQRRILRHSVIATLAIIVLGSAAFSRSLVRAYRAEASQRRAAEAATRRVERARSDAEDLLMYITEDLSSDLLPIGRVQPLDSVTSRTLTYFQTLPNNERTPATRRRELSAWHTRGMVLEEMGRIEEAAKAYESAVKTGKELADEGTRDRGLFRLLGGANSDLSNAYSTLGRREDALTSAQRGAKAYAQAATFADPDDVRSSADRLMATGRVATFLRELGRTDDALAAYEHTSTDVENILKHTPPNSPFRARVGEFRYTYASLLYRLNRLEEAVVAYRSGIDAYGEVAKAADDLQCRGFEARGRSNLGKVLDALGRREESEKELNLSIAAFEELTRSDPRNAQWLTELTNAREGLATLYYSMERFDDAAKEMAFALDVRRRQTALEPANVEARFGFALALFNSAAVGNKTPGRRPEALAHISEAIKTWKELAAQHPRVPTNLESLVKAYKMEGDILSGEARRAEARTSYDNAISSSKALEAIKALELGDLMDRGRAYLERAFTRIDAEEWESALPLLDEGIAFVRTVVTREAAALSPRILLSSFLHHRGACAARLGRFDDAVSFLAEAYEIRHDESTKTPSDKVLHDGMVKTRVEYIKTLRQLGRNTEADRLENQP